MFKRIKEKIYPKNKSARTESQPGAAAAETLGKAVQQKDSPPLPAVIWELIAEHVSDASTLKKASKVSKGFNQFFARALEEKELLHAIFMGDEENSTRILSAHPKMLLKYGIYKMPLYNKAEDGTLSLSEDCEQIYYASPLELLLYTGDFKLWDKIFRLILENDSIDKKEMLEKILATIRGIKHGGPDLVKINFDPREAIEHPPYWERLKQFNAGNDDEGHPIIYDLLKNPDGIICYQQPDGKFRYFYAHPNAEKPILIELGPVTAAEDEALQASIANLAQNSSKRTSDAEYDLIHKLFQIEATVGKKIERHGIHYELKDKCGNSIHYQDTYDGNHRLINAYRKYIEIYNATNDWSVIEKAWINNVGYDGQRHAMPVTMQFFCEKDRPFYPLPTLLEFKTRPFVRSHKFYNWTLQNPRYEHLYPLVANSGMGFNFGLYKAGRGRRLVWGVVRGVGGPGARWACLALAAVRRIEEVRTTRLNELEQELAAHLQLSSGLVPH